MSNQPHKIFAIVVFAMLIFGACRPKQTVSFRGTSPSAASATKPATGNGSLTFTVANAPGLGLADPTAQTICAYVVNYPQLRAVGNGNGSWTISGLPPGTYDVIITAGVGQSGCTGATSGTKLTDVVISVGKGSNIGVVTLGGAVGSISGIVTLAGQNDSSGITVAIPGTVFMATTDSQLRSGRTRRTVSMSIFRVLLRT